MTDFFPDDFDVTIDPAEPLFVISIASELVGLPIWTLRKLDEMGVVCARRRGKKTRCYSKEQMKKLTYIRYLLLERNVNISGIKVILEIEDKE